MKKWKLSIILSTLSVVMMLGFGTQVNAKEAETIKTGIYAESIDLSNMTAAQANEAIYEYVDSLNDVEITLLAANDQEIVTTAGELGVGWANPDLVEEALHIGTTGNIIRRYKVLKDLEHENKVYSIEFGFDMKAINDILANEGSKYDQKAVDYALTRTGGTFQIVAGQIGYMLDVESSIDVVYDYLTGDWDKNACTIALNVVVQEPKGTENELSQVTDVLGTFTTSYSSSGSSRSANVANGAALVNGTTIYPGEEFSTYEAVAPFTAANGYYMAGSYLNGKVIDSIGGGICQVSTTLYNAVLLSELEIMERHNHSMIVTYVTPSKDAAIAESAGKDFRFVNNTDYPIYIEGYVSNKNITFTIYGNEYRAANRTVTYESEVLETTYPQADAIYQDASQPIGYITTDSAHIGYKARLWKVVCENGVEVSRTQVNSSSYKMTPKSATVGTATADPNAYNEIIAAIGTGSIDHVKNVIAILTTQAQQPAEDQNTAEQPAGEITVEQPAADGQAQEVPAGE